MNNEEIKKKVIYAVARVIGVDEREIKEDSQFKTDLGTDSLDEIEILMGLETAFGITITDAEAAEINTVGDAIKLVEGEL